MRGWISRSWGTGSPRQHHRVGEPGDEREVHAHPLLLGPAGQAQLDADQLLAALEPLGEVEVLDLVPGVEVEPGPLVGERLALSPLVLERSSSAAWAIGPPGTVSMNASVTTGVEEPWTARRGRFVCSGLYRCSMMHLAPLTWSPAGRWRLTIVHAPRRRCAIAVEASPAVEHGVPLFPLIGKARPGPAPAQTPGADKISPASAVYQAQSACDLHEPTEELGQLVVAVERQHHGNVLVRSATTRAPAPRRYLAGRRMCLSTSSTGVNTFS